MCRVKTQKMRDMGCILFETLNRVQPLLVVRMQVNQNSAWKPELWFHYLLLIRVSSARLWGDDSLMTYY